MDQDAWLHEVHARCIMALLQIEKMIHSGYRGRVSLTIDKRGLIEPDLHTYGKQALWEEGAGKPVKLKE